MLGQTKIRFILLKWYGQCEEAEGGEIPFLLARLKYWQYTRNVGRSFNKPVEVSAPKGRIVGVGGELYIMYMTRNMYRGRGLMLYLDVRLGLIVHVARVRGCVLCNTMGLAFSLTISMYIYRYIMYLIYIYMYVPIHIGHTNNALKWSLGN